jgi:Rod binding domain-containing protein
MDKLINNPSLIGIGIESRMASITNASQDAQRMASQIKKAGEDFEGVFLSLMLKEMRNTLEGGFFGEESSDTYGGMFDMFVGQDLAKSQPLGISKMMLESYTKNSPTPDTTIEVATKTPADQPTIIGSAD